MKKSRFSEEQMVKILREADKSPVAQVAKKHGVSDCLVHSLSNSGIQESCLANERLCDQMGNGAHEEFARGSCRGATMKPWERREP